MRSLPLASEAFLVGGGVGLLVLALAIGYLTYTRGRPPEAAAVALAAVALLDGYLALVGGFGLTYFLHGSRRPAHTLRFVAAATAGAFGLAAFALLPWLRSAAGALKGEVPRAPLLEASVWSLVVLGAAMLAVLAWMARSRGGLDRRLAFLAHAAVIAALLPGLLPVLPPTEPPLLWAGHGAVGRWGLAASAVVAVLLAVRGMAARRHRHAPRKKEMPRALTPALLELIPPPPPPRRWGSVVPLLVFLALLCWRLGR
jgi:hypothetical protein